MKTRAGRREEWGEVRREVRAFTIIEVIVIVVILGILAAVVAPRLLSRIGDSKQAMAKSGASTLATSMQLCMSDLGGGLDAGTGIAVLMEKPGGDLGAKWKGPYLQNIDQLKDPWGKEYILRVPGEVNVDFDIVSFGKDGQPGGEDEDADIVNGKK